MKFRKWVFKFLTGHELVEWEDMLDLCQQCIQCADEVSKDHQEIVGEAKCVLNLLSRAEKRLKGIIKNAIIAYEFELEQQDYETPEEEHNVLLNEFGITQEEYDNIMGQTF